MLMHIMIKWYYNIQQQRNSQWKLQKKAEWYVVGNLKIQKNLKLGLLKLRFESKINSETNWLRIPFRNRFYVC